MYRSLTTYPGGKSASGVYQKIINQIPPHVIYLEPFLGYGAILRHKKPAKLTVGIERDETVINLRWRDYGNATIVHGDALEYLDIDDPASHIVNNPDTFIYCDPPYLLSTRSTRALIYTYELRDRDHIKLLGLIQQLPCMVAISGYWSEMYSDALTDWRSISYLAQTRGGNSAREYLWMNYPEPEQLHDYHFLGDDYRERERIKRKIQRWKRKLSRMPALERQAIMTAIDSFREQNNVSQA